MEPVHEEGPSGWRKALGWVALTAVVALALVFGTAGINVAWSNGSPGYNTSGGGFDLALVPLKHPVPDARFYCAGIGWFSASLPSPPLIAAEVNAAPSAVAHTAALQFYDDLVNLRSTTSDLVAVDAASTCPDEG